MQADPELPAGTASNDAAIVRARAQLRDAQGALERVTGGASARALLAELAQELASDLSAFFDTLPMEPVQGRLPRGAGRLARLTPRRRLPHRVILARYLSATPPVQAGKGYTLTRARIAVLALGSDGVLRSGVATEMVTLPDDAELTVEPLAWDDRRIRRVPSRSIALERWEGGNDAEAVAPPNRVIDALTAIASHVARESERDLALLKRFF